MLFRETIFVSGFDISVFCVRASFKISIHFLSERGLERKIVGPQFEKLIIQLNYINSKEYLTIKTLNYTKNLLQ